MSAKLPIYHPRPSDVMQHMQRARLCPQASSFPSSDAVSYKYVYKEDVDGFEMTDEDERSLMQWSVARVVPAMVLALVGTLRSCADQSGWSVLDVSQGMLRK